SDALNNIILNQWFLLGLTLVSAYLLNSRIELFALKFGNWSFKDNAVRYLFLVASLVLLITIRFLAIPVIVILYILLSLINKNT
ncbi:MAG: phosphatidylserine synthase, partial [Allomuricauda sp.]